MFFQQEVDGVVDHSVDNGCDSENSTDNAH